MTPETNKAIEEIADLAGIALRKLYDLYLSKDGPPAYKFEGWLAYMTSNFLIRPNHEGQFEITENGQYLVLEAGKAGMNESSLAY